MDKVSTQTRSKIMAQVRSEDNRSTERRIRSSLAGAGISGYKMHAKDLPSKPDFIFPSKKVALFVHGCFWHGHDCPHGQRMPTTNVDYWRCKIRRNMERDTKAQAALIALGWEPIVIWECQIKGHNLSKILASTLKGKNI